MITVKSVRDTQGFFGMTSPSSPELSLEGTDTPLQADFQVAEAYVTMWLASGNRLDNDTLLDFYALYKQATEGKNTKPKPSFYKVKEQRKHAAWLSLGSMSQEEAMEHYVELTKAKMGWDPEEDTQAHAAAAAEGRDQNTGAFGVAVSSMPRPSNISSATNTFEWFQDLPRDVAAQELQDKLASAPEFITAQDSMGMSLIHWAADCGDVDSVRVLLENGCPVDLLDDSGQTALHMACACGHPDVIKLLIENGADPSTKDEEGQTPQDCIDEDFTDLIELLKTKAA
eukprot:Clim_evm63s157 gene=Clim_evmTU63s157